MPSFIENPSAALFRKDIFVVGENAAAIYSPSSRLADAQAGQWTSLSCPYELASVFGQEDAIFAIGQLRSNPGLLFLLCLHIYFSFANSSYDYQYISTESFFDPI